MISISRHIKKPWLKLALLRIKMKKPQQDHFWTKYKRFAGTEILMYLIMIIGIALGIIILS